MTGLALHDAGGRVDRQVVLVLIDDKLAPVEALMEEGVSFASVFLHFEWVLVGKIILYLVCARNLAERAARVATHFA